MKKKKIFILNDKSINMLINNLKINDNSTRDEENINEDISDNE